MDETGDQIAVFGRIGSRPFTAARDAQVLPQARRHAVDRQRQRQGTATQMDTRHACHCDASSLCAALLVLLRAVVPSAPRARRRTRDSRCRTSRKDQTSAW